MWVLAQGKLHKSDCYHILGAAGIALPQMYRLGFRNNNCIGCVKGGKGYWNKIRLHFPDVFKRRAWIEREIAQLGANENRPIIFKDVFLDELPADAGQDVPEPDIECGMFCSRYADLLADTVKRQGAL